VGIGQIGHPTQERLNKIVNQRLNNVDLVLNRQGLYNGNDPLLNTKQLQVAKPGKFHKVSDVNGSVRWMDIPDVTASSYNEEKLAKQIINKASNYALFTEKNENPVCVFIERCECKKLLRNFATFET